MAIHHRESRNQLHIFTNQIEELKKDVLPLGLTPVRMAAVRGNKAAVEILLLLTSRVETVQIGLLMNDNEQINLLLSGGLEGEKLEAARLVSLGPPRQPIDAADPCSIPTPAIPMEVLMSQPPISNSSN
ncbi:hypothetical protein Tco_1207740 [Tanacetum coccineum]